MKYINFLMSVFWIPVLFFIAREYIPDQWEYTKMNWRLK